MSDFQFDLREFEKALDFVADATGKDSVDILNNAGLHTIIGGKGVKGAIQRTPRANIADIQKEADIILRMVIKENSEKRLGLNREQIGERVKKILNQRKQARGYTAGPGWNKAAVAFGGRGVKIQGGFDKSLARFGSGTKARPSLLVSEFVNTAPAAELIGQKPLQDALNDVTRDMIEYGLRKLASTMKKVSA